MILYDQKAGDIMDKTVVSKRLLSTIEEKGMSYGEVAKLTGIPKSAVHRYSTGETAKIPIDRIESMANVLGVSAAYLMGWDNADSVSFPAPKTTDDVVTFPVIGEVAAGYNEIAIEDWTGDTIEIPASYLRGRPQTDFFVLTVHGDSMYPLYIPGDKVLVQKADTLNSSGDIGVLLYDGDNSTIKKIEYKDGEDWLRMVPLNPNYPPQMIQGADSERCRVIGIPRLIVREIKQ